MSDLKVKIEARVKAREKMAASIQSNIESLAIKINEFTDHDLETYRLLTKPDALYNDSPISKFFTFAWIKQYMIKQDMDFVGHFIDGKINIKSFVDRATEASGWILRFTKNPEAIKTGIEAIL